MNYKCKMVNEKCQSRLARSNTFTFFIHHFTFIIHFLTKFLLKKRNGASPGEFGSRFVVARTGGVVVKGVLRTFVNIQLIRHIRFLQGFLVGRNPGVNPLIHPPIMQLNGRFDFGNIGDFGLTTVERNGGFQIGVIDGQLV